MSDRAFAYLHVEQQVLPTKNRIVPGQNHCPLNDVLQFPDISRPAARPQRLQKFKGKFRRGGTHGIFFDEMLRQQIDVFRPLAQSGNLHRKCAKAVVKVFTKPALSDQRIKTRIRRGDHARIHAHDLRISQPLQLFLLKKAQQLRLQAQRHLANFIEKQSSTLRRLNPPAIRLQRAGKCSPAIAKELGFKKGFGNGSAVHHRKRARRPAPPLACAIRRAGDRKLSNTRRRTRVLGLATRM